MDKHFTDNKHQILLYDKPGLQFTNSDRNIDYRTVFSCTTDTLQ